ncbi:hypothetical protein, partial [Acidianus sp. RZ1]|uniref:hypothetical protein n=1 Tax=Acidianus sp. RZ1 TaxID=1540082 RepID=UPI001491DECA
MRVKIEYDDGKTEEVELKRVEVVQSTDGKRYAHMRFVRKDEPVVIIHAYIPTDEEPSTIPKLPIKEIENKINLSKSYSSTADDLISRAKSSINSPRVEKCFYCENRPTNVYNGKKVCSSCFNVLVKYGEESKEFNSYLKNKII